MSTSPKVLMYSSDFCPFCHKAMRLLSSKGIEPEVRSVDGNAAIHAEMISRSGRHTVPQIFIGEEHVGGCDDLHALERQNRLNAILNP